MKIQTLASGSKGNCIYIASDTTNILVDVGLTLTQLTKRLSVAGINPASINAVLVTHDHIDHVLGLEHFLARYKCKLYIHRESMKHFKSVPPEITEAFDGAFRIGDITVTPIPLSHDSNFCFGYTFERGAAKISIATDLGFIDDDVIAKMEHSQIVLLESNHDITQLNNNKKYSPFLKRRILGATGHLSNPQCAAAVYKLYQSGLTQVVLAHLSRENNSPNTAYTTVCEFLKRNGVTEGEDIWVDVALQDTVGRVFQTE